MVDDELSRSIVRTIHEICGLLNIKTVVEFVEDTDTLVIARDIGIDYAQGYGIAEPAPMEDLF